MTIATYEYSTVETVHPESMAPIKGYRVTRTIDGMTIDYLGRTREGLGLFVYKGRGYRLIFYAPMQLITHNDPYDKPVRISIGQLFSEQLNRDTVVQDLDRSKIRGDISAALRNAPLSLGWRGAAANNDVLFFSEE